jgi:hypothetical protein
MPDAPARAPGSRRRGCSRPPRTGRTARSHRSATRRPHPADPVRSAMECRSGQHCILELLVLPGRGTCTRAETARAVLPRPAGRTGWLRTSPARPRPDAGIPRREGVVPRVQRRKLAHQAEDVGVAGERTRAFREVFAVRPATWPVHRWGGRCRAFAPAPLTAPRDHRRPRQCPGN